MSVARWSAGVLAVVVGIMPVPAERPPADEIHCGVEMRNVRLHLAEGVVLAVRSLDGEFVSRTNGRPPVFDDPKSYTLRVRSADLSMDARSLTNLLAQRGLGSDHSPLRDARITIEDGALRVHGRLKKGISVPFSMTAALSAAGDGSMRLHATKIKAAGLPVKGLLDLLHLDVEDLMKMPAGTGLRAEGDDVLIDTAAVLPPPRTEGRLRQVAVTGQQVRMQMSGPGTPPARPKTLPLPRATNYVYFFGGSIRFGKLTMSDADLQLIDAQPRDPFDFFPAHYEKQLIAGYSRNTPRKGLQVYMPDYSDVARKTSRLAAPKVQ
jgi:hypothetical protein